MCLFFGHSVSQVKCIGLDDFQGWVGFVVKSLEGALLRCVWAQSGTAAPPMDFSIIQVSHIFLLQVCWKNYHLQKQPRACSQVGLATISLVLLKEAGHLHQISRIWTCAAIFWGWLFFFNHSKYFVLKGDLQLISLLRLFCHCVICLNPSWGSNAAPPGNILPCWWATNLPGNCKILFFQGKAET